MCDFFTRQVLFLLLLLGSVAVDVHYTWKAWPTAESQAYLHGGGPCSSAWDCNLHGLCENIEGPSSEVTNAAAAVGQRKAGPPLRQGQCECFVHYTGSHCSVHIFLLELSLRLDEQHEQRRRPAEGSDAGGTAVIDSNVPRVSSRLTRSSAASHSHSHSRSRWRSHANVDSVSLNQHQRANQYVSHWALIVIGVAIGVMLGATLVLHDARTDILWILLPFLLPHFNSMLLNLPSKILTEAQVHGRMVVS